MLHIKLAQFAVRCALPPRRSESPVCAKTINPLACCICWAGLLGRAVFPPWNKGQNSGSYTKSLQLCLTLCDLMDCSPPGSSVHGILQERILEWVAISFSRGSSQFRSNPRLLHLLHSQVGSLPLVPPGKPHSMPRRPSNGLGSDQTPGVPHHTRKEFLTGATRMS